MATRMYPQNSATFPGAGPELTYLDMLVTQGVSVSGYGFTVAADVNGERQMLIAGVNPVTIFSERVSAEVTVSGTVTFNVWASLHSTAFTAKLRARLYKITSGGSAIETLITEADSATLAGSLGVSMLYNFTATPGTAVTLGPNERFVLRVFLVILTGTYDSAFNVQLRAGGGVAGVNGDTYVEVTETITMVPNGTTLYLRRTTTIGIGTHFDMLASRGSSAATTGVVSTVSGPTDPLQWTRTAGGTLLSWISPRLSGQWTPDRNEYFKIWWWAHESAAQANASTRVRVYRDRGGVELQIVHSDPGLSELTTAAARYDALAWTLTPATFLENDRIVLKLFIDDAPSSMASGRTCTVTYDHNVAGGTGDCAAMFMDLPPLKLETDGDMSQVVPNAGMMGGVSNGT